MSALPPPRDQSPVLREYSRLAKDYDARWSFYVEVTTRETLSRRPSGLQPACWTWAAAR
jgi:hypothetical protein